MKTTALCLISLLTLGLSAQTLDDVELFYKNDLKGTARFLGMSGAFTALGNDFSSIHLNPAGAAVFRKSQFGGSLGFASLNASQQGLFEERNTYNNFELNLDNLGFVLKDNTKGYAKSSGWAFAVTYNKIADFNRQYTLTGINGPGISERNTLGQYYLFREDVYSDGIPGAQGLDISEISDEAYAAYQAGLLVDWDDDGIIDDYGYAFDGSNNQVSYFRNQYGSHNQVGLTLAGEVDNEFYFGGALNIPTLNSTLEDRVSESSLAVDTFPFDVQSYDLNRVTAINATGINLNFGFIVVPARWIRIGASVQTPTWYGVNEVYEFDIQASYADGTSGSSDVFSTGDYSYRLTTPAVYRGGLGFLLPQKSGIISIDYEYQDPANTFIKRSGNRPSIEEEFATDANLNIENFMTSIHKLKAGVELRLGPVMLRGGTGYSSSLYGDSGFRSNVLTFSGGLGYQNKDFGIDLGVANSQYSRQDVVHPFLEESGNALINNDFSLTNVVMGFHLKF